MNEKKLYDSTLGRQGRKAIDDFITQLREIPPEKRLEPEPHASLHRAYKNRLISLQLPEDLIKYLTSLSYVAFEFEQKTMTPDNLHLLSDVVQYQIRVESYLRRYLEALIPQFPWRAFDQKWGFKDYIDIWKHVSTEDLKALRHALREVGEVRNKFAHRLNYKLELRDLRKIKAFLDSREGSSFELELVDTIDYYIEFCNLACRYFHARIWDLRTDNDITKLFTDC